MVNYVYDDIITAKDIFTGRVKKEDIIGAPGWFLDIIPEDMSVNTLGRIGHFGILKDIRLEYAGAFREYATGPTWIYFMPEKKSYKERQAEWIEANGIKIGDKVRVRRKAGSHENGWTNTWASDMDEAIGNIRVVSEFYATGIELDDPAVYRYPYFFLEKAKDQPDSISSSNEDADQPEYVPFDLDNPEVRRELMGKTIINNYGLDGDGEFREVMIVGFMNKSDEDRDCWSSNGDTEGTIAMTVEGYFHADELLKECTFSDGTPCGRLKED